MHDWNVTIDEAIELQVRLRSQVEHTNGFALSDLKTVAGIDASYQQDLGRAAVVVFSYPDLQVVEQATAVTAPSFPYVPGLLSFREGPVVLAALQKLPTLPDLLIFDGHGYAHPRRFGLASHLGVFLDRPTIGCAKTLLTGTYDEPGANPGDYSFLLDNGETIGAVLRTRAATRPVFVSTGHKIDLAATLQIVMQCVRGYRLPEPTRAADILAATVPFIS